MYKSIDKSSQHALFFHLFELKIWILTPKNPKTGVYPPPTIVMWRVRTKLEELWYAEFTLRTYPSMLKIAKVEVKRAKTGPK